MSLSKDYFVEADSLVVSKFVLANILWIIVNLKWIEKAVTDNLFLLDSDPSLPVMWEKIFGIDPSRIYIKQVLT